VRPRRHRERVQRDRAVRAALREAVAVVVLGEAQDEAAGAEAVERELAVGLGAVDAPAAGDADAGEGGGVAGVGLDGGAVHLTGRDVVEAVEVVRAPCCPDDDANDDDERNERSERAGAEGGGGGSHGAFTLPPTTSKRPPRY